MHYLRLKKANKIAKKVFRKYYDNDYCLKYLDDNDKKRLIGKFRKLKVPCSGPCCGNPRKFFNEKTKQEKIASEIEKQEIELYFSCEKIIEENPELVETPDKELTNLAFKLVENK